LLGLPISEASEFGWACLDLHPRGQRSLHWAFLCYREQCLPLLRGEITNKPNIELNAVNQSRLSVAVSAIFGMHFGV
jgi:hypothetical protein